jgi:hypothetical protein
VTDGYRGEVPLDGFTLTHEADRSLRVGWRGTELFRYVYRPWDPQRESPRPYFHPLATLSGRTVSLYRPHDHVWHKGLSWSLSNVALVDPASGEVVTHNFWGGPTYLRTAGGYCWPENNGTQRHDAFERIEASPDGLDVVESLTWVTQPGVTAFTERRRLRVRVRPDDGAWQLTFATEMHNETGATVTFGSPTTEGRPDAGYSGLFWRGLRSFSGGSVLLPDKVGADDLNGARGAWLAFVGRHDGDGGASTLLFTDRPDNPRHPTEWFVRSEVYAVVAPALFFSTEYELAADATLRLCYDLFVVDGALDQAGCTALAAMP